MKLNKSKHCLNCHREINDSNYCPHCGQLNSDKKLTLRQILKEFLGDYFTFDSKFFRSLFPLIFKPGHLTREYLKGKRVSYIFPLRLYLFTTFLFFFVVTVNTKMDFDKYTEEAVATDSTQIEKKADDIPWDMDENFEERIKSETKKNIIYSVDSSDTSNETKVEGPGFRFSFGDSTADESAFARYMNNKGKYLASLGEDGSAMFWKEIINQLPKVMFVLLPLFALFLKVLYARRKILYVEHLVFSLHIHTFIFIMLIAASLISNVYIIFGIVFIIFIYIFLSQYNFYKQSVIKSIFKFMILMSFYFFALIPAFAILAFLAFVSV